MNYDIIFNKPVAELFNPEKQISNTTYSTVIRAFDFIISYLQSIIINTILHKNDLH